jgi:hypothetical protein
LFSFRSTIQEKMGHWRVGQPILCECIFTGHVVSITYGFCLIVHYAKALDDLFAVCASRPLSRSLLMEWRAGMESLRD